MPEPTIAERTLAWNERARRIYGHPASEQECNRGHIKSNIVREALRARS